MATIITKIGSAVIEAMEAHGYSTSSIKSYARCLTLLVDFCLEKGSDYSSEVGSEFIAEMSHSSFSAPKEKSWPDLGRCVRFVDSYIQAGEADFSRPKTGLALLSYFSGLEPLGLTILM